MTEKLIESPGVVDVNGEEYNYGIYANTDGRYHMVFKNDVLPKEVDTRKRNIMRLGFRKYDDSVLFLGMNVPNAMRRQGVGRALFNEFMGHIEDTGSEFMGTGLIHKPLIALMLSKQGLKPVDDSCRVEVLPSSVYDESDIPRIHFLSRGVDIGMHVDRSPAGMFYEEVDCEEVLLRYPMNCPSMVVALHTNYVPVDVSEASH